MRMNVFIIRAVLGVAFAVALVRIFKPGLSTAYVIALAIFMVAMAYFLELLRTKRTKDEGDSNQ